MPITRLSLKYRPIRIGFLIEDGQIDQLVKAVGINTLLWGGHNNPIIPIKKDGDNAGAHQLIKLFSVDALCSVSGAAEISNFKKQYQALTDPGHYGENIFYEDWHTKKKISAYLDIKKLVDYLWQNGYRDKPKDFKSPFSLYQWDEKDPLSKVFSIQFGFYLKPNDFKYDFEKIFLNGLRASKQVIASDKNLSADWLEHYSPIEATSAELTGYPSGHRFNGNGLYIGKSDNFYDLVSFWNIRASGVRLVFLSHDALERSLPFAQGFLDNLNKLPNKHPNIEDRLTVYHRLPGEIDQTLMARLTSKKPITWSQVSEYSWNGLNIQPYYYIFKWDRTSANVEKTYDRYAVYIKLSTDSFLSEEDDGLEAQYLGVVVDPYGSYAYPDHTLRPPAIEGLNEFFGREVSGDPWRVRIGRDGVTFIIKSNDDSLDLYPVPEWELIKKIFELAGLTIKVSQAGLIAKKILEKIDGVEGARVFKIKGVRKLLQEKKSDDFLVRGEAVRVIYENDFEKHKKLFIEPREKGDLNSNDVFNFLLKKDFFRAGLELECQHCKLKSWLSLKEIDDHWTCEYCGGSNQTSMHLKDRGDWRFRKSGLFAKDNHQEGAIPVLLTLLTLKRIADLSNPVYSTSLNLSGDGVNCESDLVILQYGERRKTEIGIGECKSEGGAINEDDCNKLKAVYKKLANIEATKVYLIFTKTADSFTAEEIECFKKLNAEDVPLILFTNQELEPYHPYWGEHKEEKDIPQKYPHSLSELSQNSLARYLQVSKRADD